MGIIQKQSIRSTIFIMIGFAIGAINMMVLAPKILTPEQIGLTRVITDAGLVLATTCTLGCIPIIYKFFPFYQKYIPSAKNDLPFLSLMVCLIGIPIVYTAGYFASDIVVRKFSQRSPLFVQYSYLVYPFSFFMLAFIWLESFAWSLKRGVISNTLRETGPRMFFTVLLCLFAFKVFTADVLYKLYSFSFLIPTIILLIVMRKTKEFYIPTTITPLTYRLKGKMINFGLFLFGAQFLNLLSRTIDTFILTAKSEKGLADAAIFTLATYVVTLMEVPQRSITAISTPVLSESWMKKDMVNIENVYRKSVSNLLIIGLAMLALMTLNINNLALFLGKDYAGIEMVILIMGIGKLIDLGTGANSQIILTSSFWKVDFTTNVIYTIIALPLNYILISHFGLMGAAYATIISQTVYNLMRFCFLWYQFNLQPYTWKHLAAVVTCGLGIYLIAKIPQQPSIYIDTLIRSALFLVTFIPLVFAFKVSAEFNAMAIKYWQKAIGMVKK